MSALHEVRFLQLVKNKYFYWYISTIFQCFFFVETDKYSNCESLKLCKIFQVYQTNCNNFFKIHVLDYKIFFHIRITFQYKHVFANFLSVMIVSQFVKF